jgi:hypothetical protein
MSNKTWQRVPFENAADKTPPEIDFCLPNPLASDAGIVAVVANNGKISLQLP